MYYIYMPCQNKFTVSEIRRCSFTYHLFTVTEGNIVFCGKSIDRHIPVYDWPTSCSGLLMLCLYLGRSFWSKTKRHKQYFVPRALGLLNGN